MYINRKIILLLGNSKECDPWLFHTIFDKIGFHSLKNTNPWQDVKLKNYTWKYFKICLLRNVILMVFYEIATWPSSHHIDSTDRGSLLPNINIGRSRNTNSSVKRIHNKVMLVFTFSVCLLNI